MGKQVEDEYMSSSVIYAVTVSEGWVGSSTSDTDIVIGYEGIEDDINDNNRSIIENANVVVSTCLNALSVVENYDLALVSKSVQRSIEQVKKLSIKITHEQIKQLTEQDED